jgi:hypothetical protein
MTSNRASLGTRLNAALCAALLTPSSVIASALTRPQAATSTTPGDDIRWTTDLGMPFSRNRAM